MSTLTLETELVATLQPLCPRVFPDVAPQGTATPYVVWSQYGGSAITFTEGVMADRRHCLVQVNVWGPSRAECNQLMLDIEAALVARASLQAQPIASINTMYDEDTALRGAMQDFSLWAAR